MNNHIKDEVDKIDIPKGLHKRAQIGVMKAKAEKPRRRFQKIAIPLIASAFLLLTTGVGAANLTSINNLVAMLSPNIALLLKPIEMVNESDGIKMEVVAAMNDHDTAVIYVTLQDLTSNRIDETVDLYDYSFTGGHIFTSEIVDFEDQTNTATLRIQGNGAESLDKEKINFHITSFLSDKKTFDISADHQVLELASRSPETIQLNMDNIPGGGGELFESLSQQEIIQILKPNTTEFTFPEIDFMHVSNIGMIEDRLHIQAKWSGNDVDSHGDIHLIDDSNHKIYPSTVNFGLNAAGQTDYGHEFTEYIFDLKDVDLKDLKLMGHFVKNGKHTSGDWNTTFNMQSVENDVKRDFKQQFGPWSARSLTVSPLGVTIHGNGQFEDSTELEIAVKMADGSMITLDSMTLLSQDEKVIVKFMPNLPLDLPNITAVMINGEEIDL